MRLLMALLLVCAVALGALLFIPLAGLALAFALPFGWLLIWFLPILIIACSNRTGGGEKLAWILAIVFLSWFAWIFYFLLAPISQRPAHDDYRRRLDYGYYDSYDRRYRYR